MRNMRDINVLTLDNDGVLINPSNAYGMCLSD